MCKNRQIAREKEKRKKKGWVLVHPQMDVRISSYQLMTTIWFLTLGYRATYGALVG
jgi:hypothetical protein